MTDAPRRAPFPVGKVLTSAAALVPAVGAFVADWNETHVFNPRWPPHAKFHNAQTITLSVVAAGLTLWETWRPGPTDRSRLRWATTMGGLFWLTQAPAILFPGTAFVDAENGLQTTRVGPVPVNQLTAVGALVLPLLSAGYALELRRCQKSGHLQAR